VSPRTCVYFGGAAVSTATPPASSQSWRPSAWIAPLAWSVRFGRHVLRTLFFQRVIRMMEGIGPIDDPAALVRLACRGFWGAITPNQNQQELTSLLTILRCSLPSRILEIGTASGGTLFAFTRVASSDAHLLSVDLPGGPGGNGYPDWKIPLFERFALPCQRIDLIRDDSHDPTVFRRVVALLRGRCLDFLFIDGDHSYSGVKRDFEMYSPLVRPGGLIAFHDIMFIDDVHAFWNEVKVAHRSEELLAADGRRYGIGVIYWDGLTHQTASSSDEPLGGADLLSHA
jgi:predicted O-methyltransferase YrrM